MVYSRCYTPAALFAKTPAPEPCRSISTVFAQRNLLSSLSALCSSKYLYAPQAQTISSKKLTSVIVKKVFSRCFLFSTSRAEKVNQRGLARLQTFVPESRWLHAILFKNCQNTDLKQTPSHPVLHCHHFWDEVLKLAVSELASLLGQAQQRANCAHTRRALFPCALSKARLVQAQPFFASRLNGACHSLETLPVAASSTSPARKCRRWQPKAEACNFGRYASF